jgi:hypothetical protein
LDTKYELQFIALITASIFPSDKCFEMYAAAKLAINAELRAGFHVKALFTVE